MVVNVQDLHTKQVFCRAAPADDAFSGDNFVVSPKSKLESNRSFSEPVGRAQTKPAAAKGYLLVRDERSESS